ncbi:ankyrin repeat domain-containing protein [Burkholderia vietnamiensis]|uniref:ankyrin repeat domain-containing protein n=1 Tax=Burkholderia vietnamiensis TaxID=60552 RepID=UPI001CF29E83|nr:ankyrin repeat domain-containing protein [Burkholderia vietnamiensis]MCA8448943.1 ankyrin repeat domain-containing protein [Burkholderia vietnamiensis]
MSTPFIEQVRTKLAAHAPGSRERFEQLKRAKGSHELRVEQREREAWERTCPPGFVPLCPTCKALPVQRRRRNRWVCPCGASGSLDDKRFVGQYVAEQVKQYDDKDRAKVDRWLSRLATYNPTDPWGKRQRLPAGVRTSLCKSLQAALHGMYLHATEGYQSFLDILYIRLVWDRGGDALLYVLLKSILGRGYSVQAAPGRPWLNIFRSVNENNLPSIERAWRLLDVVALSYLPWLVPNTLVEIQTSTDPVASFHKVPGPMRALVKRYIDVHYDALLSDLLATAQRQARKPSKRNRVVQQLVDLRGRADTSAAHLEKWCVVRDHLVSMGYTTPARANGNLLPRLLDSKALDEDDALRWTQRLLNGLTDDPEVRHSNLYDATIAAAGNGWISVVDLLMTHGITLHDVGLEAVVVALRSEHHAMVDHLLERGVDVGRVLEAIEEYGPDDMESLRAVLRAWEARTLRTEAEAALAEQPEPVVRAARRRL